MLSVWILNRNWQNVGLVLSFPQKPVKDRDEISEVEMEYIRCSAFSQNYFFSYVWKIVHFGKTICYAAEIGESEGQTGKRQDVEFGKKQGRRISPSSGLCSPLLEMSTIEIISHLSSNFLWKAQKWGMLWVLLTDKASVNFTRNTEITTIWTVTLNCFLLYSWSDHCCYDPNRILSALFVCFCELFVWAASECKWFVFPCKHRQEIHSPEKVMIGWRNSSKTEYNCAKIQKLLIISIFFCLESPPKLLLKACLLSVCLRSPPVYFVPKIGAHLLRMSKYIQSQNRPQTCSKNGRKLSENLVLFPTEWFHLSLSCSAYIVQ